MGDLIERETAAAVLQGLADKALGEARKGVMPTERWIEAGKEAGLRSGIAALRALPASTRYAELERAAREWIRTATPDTAFGLRRAVAYLDGAAGVGVTWRQQGWEYNDVFDWSCSGCGKVWQFIDDGPAENGMDYCPKCGQRITTIVPALDGAQ